MTKLTPAKNILIIVDPQIDFIADSTHPVSKLLPPITFDLPDGNGGFCRPLQGALAVPGAMADTKVLVDYIMREIDVIDDMFVTLDSHQAIHIAHPIYWMDAQGNSPAPFTVITVEDVERRTWAPRISALYDKSLTYVKSLKANGRYVLCIWPPHCKVGTLGHAIMPEISDALYAWETKRIARVNFLPKGNNPFTEHYSAIKADVEDPTDVTTKFDPNGVISALADDTVGVIRIAGQALSHCVANTIEDIIALFGPQVAAKMELIRNATSNVPGFAAMGDAFEKRFIAAGGKIITV